MPANRMKAAVGSTLKVIGSSRAMGRAGPSPGSTPIGVPNGVPTRDPIRLGGVGAAAKPLSSCSKAPMSRRLDPEHRLDCVLDESCTDIDAECLGEAEIGDEREHRRDRDIAHDVARAKSARDAD